MESGNFKEAEEVFERIFGDPDSHTVIIYSKAIELIIQLFVWGEENRKLKEKKMILLTQYIKKILTIIKTKI